MVDIIPDNLVNVVARTGTRRLNTPEVKVKEPPNKDYFKKDLRALAERSYLYFKYDSEANQDSREFYLPMLENVEIVESQKPNLATYDILGRPGNVFAYLGAKSREFQLRFKITLPHVHHYVSEIGLSNIFYNGARNFSNNKEIKRLSMKNFGKSKTDPSKLNYYKIAEDNYFELISDNLSIENTKAFAPIVQQFLFGDLDDNKTRARDKFNTVGGGGLPSKENNQSFINAVNFVILWLNVIRTSVVGNATNTTQGPPVIYINHGTMYNNIPCVCTNYNIRNVLNVGYDLLSLTPRQLEISMTLSENRTGSFNKFQPFKLIDNEAVAGWEAVINYGTIDSYEKIRTTMDAVKILDERGIGGTGILNSGGLA